MPRRNVYHVVPTDDSWGVRLEGSSQMSATADTRGHAVEAAGEILRTLGTGRVIVHDADGRIEAGYALDALPASGGLRTRDVLLLVLGGAAIVGIAFGVRAGVQRRG